MRIGALRLLINIALEEDPPPFIANLCGKYYQPYYHLLYLLAGFASGKAIELGVEQGRGSGSLALAEIEVVSIDHTRHPDIVKVEEQFPNLTFLECDSLPVPDTVEGPVSILHIDTEHSYSQAKAEFEAYEEYLEKGAVVLFDDLHAQEDAVLKYFFSLPYLKIRDDRLHPTCGYGVLIYE